MSSSAYQKIAISIGDNAPGITEAERKSLAAFLESFNNILTDSLYFFLWILQTLIILRIIIDFFLEFFQLTNPLIDIVFFIGYLMGILIVFIFGVAY